MQVKVINNLINPMITHLNRRGILTSYWVLNSDDEMKYVLEKTTIAAVMTDRP